MHLFTRFLLVRLILREAELYMERNFAFRKSLGIIKYEEYCVRKNFSPTVIDGKASKHNDMKH